MSDGLISIPDPKSVFVNNQVDAVLQRVREHVSTLVFDVSTGQGRKECGSVAMKVARSKTLLDNAGKDLVSDWKRQAKQVDIQRKRLRDSLDQIKAEVRAPLTAWEDEQRRQRQLREKQVSSLRHMASPQHDSGRDLTAAELHAKLALLNDIPEPDDWYGDLIEPAREAWNFARQSLEAAIIVREKQEQEEAAARKAAEEERERAFAERIKRERAAAVEAERRRAEQEKKVALERAEKEKQAAIDAERRWAAAEAERKAQIESRRREKEQQERERVERLAQDKKHRAEIDAAIRAALIEHTGIGTLHAAEVVSAIADGLIPHVRIEY